MLTRQQKQRVEALDNIPIPSHYQYQKVHESTVQDIDTFKKNVYDHYIQGLPKEHVSLDDSYLLSHLHKCKNLPSHLLMINKYPVDAQFAVIWAQLDPHLCEFAIAIFEGIDILMSSLLLQDPENASVMYDMALNLGALKLPQKLPHSVLLYHRQKDIDSQLYMYKNV